MLTVVVVCATHANSHFSMLPHYFLSSKMLLFIFFESSIFSVNFLLCFNLQSLLLHLLLAFCMWSCEPMQFKGQHSTSAVFHLYVLQESLLFQVWLTDLGGHQSTGQRWLENNQGSGTRKHWSLRHGCSNVSTAAPNRETSASPFKHWCHIRYPVWPLTLQMNSVLINYYILNPYTSHHQQCHKLK